MAVRSAGGGRRKSTASDAATKSTDSTRFVPGGVRTAAARDSMGKPRALSCPRADHQKKQLSVSVWAVRPPE
jgi:hypothetical protein